MLMTDAERRNGGSHEVLSNAQCVVECVLKFIETPLHLNAIRGEKEA